LNFGWGKKQWWFMIPVFLIILLPMWRLYRPGGDYRKELQINMEETRAVDSNIEILGTIKNSGKATWENISIDAEFFNADGKFVDEAAGCVSSSVGPGELEHFKITIENASEQIRDDNIRMELKVADAFSSSF